MNLETSANLDILQTYNVSLHGAGNTSAPALSTTVITCIRDYCYENKLVLIYSKNYEITTKIWDFETNTIEDGPLIGKDGDRYTMDEDRDTLVNTIRLKRTVMSSNQTAERHVCFTVVTGTHLISNRSICITNYPPRNEPILDTGSTCKYMMFKSNDREECRRITFMLRYNDLANTCNIIVEKNVERKHKMYAEHEEVMDCDDIKTSRSLTMIMLSDDTFCFLVHDRIYIYNSREMHIRRSSKQSLMFLYCSMVQQRDNNIVVIGTWEDSDGEADWGRTILIYDFDTLNCIKKTRVSFKTFMSTCIYLPNNKMLVCEKDFYSMNRVTHKKSELVDFETMTSMPLANFPVSDGCYLARILPYSPTLFNDMFDFKQ